MERRVESLVLLMLVSTNSRSSMVRMLQPEEEAEAEAAGAARAHVTAAARARQAARATVDDLMLLVRGQGSEGKCLRRRLAPRFLCPRWRKTEEEESWPPAGLFRMTKSRGGEEPEGIRTQHVRWRVRESTFEGYQKRTS